MWKKVLKSNLFWDAIIVLAVVVFFGQPVLGVLAELAMFYVWMIVIGIALAIFIGWSLTRAMNPKRKNDEQVE
jgi:hypothetical protein